MLRVRSLYEHPMRCGTNRSRWIYPSTKKGGKICLGGLLPSGDIAARG